MDDRTCSKCGRYLIWAACSSCWQDHEPATCTDHCGYGDGAWICPLCDLEENAQ